MAKLTWDALSAEVKSLIIDEVCRRRHEVEASGLTLLRSYDRRIYGKSALSTSNATSLP